jgi:hypothetical protein
MEDNSWNAAVLFQSFHKLFSCTLEKTTLDFQLHHP